jgi:PAS domain S-box-containing protein
MGYLESLRSRVGNALIPLAYSTVLIRDENGRMLFQRRSDFGVWGLPGGILELGESPEACARREAREETGLTVRPVRLTAVLSSPRHSILYPNGDRVQQVSIFFECSIVSGSLRADGGESSALAFFPLEALPPTLPWYKLAIEKRNEAEPFFDPPEFSAPSPGSVESSTWSALRARVGSAPLILPGATALIRDDRGRVLLVRRMDSGLWSLPGGLLELGESLAGTVIRETEEETGLRVEPTRIRGVIGGTGSSSPAEMQSIRSPPGSSAFGVRARRARTETKFPERISSTPPISPKWSPEYGIDCWRCWHVLPPRYFPDAIPPTHRVYNHLRLSRSHHCKQAMKKTVGSKTAKPLRRRTSLPTRPAAHPRSRLSRSAFPVAVSPRSFHEIMLEKTPEKIRLPKEKPLRVLIVEDLEDDALLMARELERDGYSVQYLRVDTPEAMSRALETQSWDVVLSDHSMPKFSAPSALGEIKRHGLDLPFILVSGSIGEDQAVSIMKAGASDYLRKDQLGRLLPVVEREIREAAIRRARSAAEEALRKSETLYRTLIDTSPDAVLVTDLDTRIRVANPRALKLLGAESAEELIGKRWLDSIAPLPARSLNQILEKVLGAGRVEAAEVDLARSDGSDITAELSASLLSGSGGPSGAILFILRDVTEHKKDERRIRQQLEKLAALRTIDAAITASLDLRVTLMVILDELTSQLHVDAADIFLLNPVSQTLRFSAGRGFRSVRQKDTYLPLNRGNAGRAALERRVLFLPRWSPQQDDPSRGESLRAEGFVTYLAAPLVAKGQAKGVLEVFHRAPLEPDPEWISYLETVAEQAAIAIDNAKLFEDLQRTNTELTLAYDATIEGWSRALDLRDRETEGHTQRVTENTLRLARSMGMPESELVHARRGCLLHDIGKMAIPDKILLKPGPLLPEELDVMRQHPTFAFEWLSSITFLRPTLDIPYCHHERWDGNGYPRRLKGEQIPLAARIFAVVDIWDALRSNRPYREAWPDARIKDYLKSLEGEYFDPRVLHSFMDMYYAQ